MFKLDSNKIVGHRALQWSNNYRNNYKLAKENNIYHSAYTLNRWLLSFQNIQYTVVFYLFC